MLFLFDFIRSVSHPVFSERAIVFIFCTLGGYCYAPQPCIGPRHLGICGGQIAIVKTAGNAYPVPSMIAPVFCSVCTLTKQPDLAAEMFECRSISAAHRASVYKRIIGRVRQPDRGKRSVVLAQFGYHGSKIAIFSRIREICRHTVNDALANSIKKAHPIDNLRSVVGRNIVGIPRKKINGAKNISRNIGIVICPKSGIIGSECLVPPP